MRGACPKCPHSCSITPSSYSSISTSSLPRIYISLPPATWLVPISPIALSPSVGRLSVLQKNRQRLEFKFWIDSENALHSLIDRIQNRKRRRGTRCGIVRAAPAGGGIQIPDAIRCAAIEYTAFHP